ncbi:MAG TPA: hypothetical protein VEC13_01745, partial [Candidatus Paceibacterota bacterium]|nr:hypothetical protein [Candidatus Paceibacterota bacterium]
MKKTYSFLLGTALLLGVAGSASAKINWNATVNSSNYDYGDSLTVNWTPKLPGVSTIQMVSATDEKGALGMYGQLVFGDPTNTKGTFTYDFPAYRVVPAGEYKIKLFPANGDDPFYSPKFTIDSPNGTSIKQEKQQFNIKKITGLKKKHAADSSLSLEIQAFEYAKVPADRLNGFNVQVSISDPLLPYAGYLQNENAEYDSAKKVWKVGLKVPSDARTYELKAVLYCADFSFNSYCAQKYGDSKSFEKKMKFRVEAKNSKKTKSKII